MQAAASARASTLDAAQVVGGAVTAAAALVLVSAPVTMYHQRGCMKGGRGGERRYIGFLRCADGTRCTGALISPHHVLTAGAPPPPPPHPPTLRGGMHPGGGTTETDGSPLGKHPSLSCICAALLCFGGNLAALAGVLRTAMSLVPVRSMAGGPKAVYIQRRVGWGRAQGTVCLITAAQGSCGTPTQGSGRASPTT